MITASILFWNIVRFDILELYFRYIVSNFWNAQPPAFTRARKIETAPRSPCATTQMSSFHVIAVM